MSRRTWIIVVAAAATALAIVAGVLGAVFFGQPDEPDPASTAPVPVATATYEPGDPAPAPTLPGVDGPGYTQDPAGDGHDHGTSPGQSGPVDPHNQDNHGTYDGYISMSMETTKQMQNAAGDAALAWVQYSTAESVEARAARLDDWFAGDTLTAKPLLSRADWAKKYLPDMAAEVTADGVKQSTLTEPTEAEGNSGYMAFRVDVSFVARWAVGSSYETACAHDLTLRMLVPWTVNADQTELVFDGSRPFQVVEPSTHACL